MEQSETGHKVQLFVGQSYYCQIDQLGDARSVERTYLLHCCLAFCFLKWTVHSRVFELLNIEDSAANVFNKGTEKGFGESLAVE
jgi:hypothetical protein